MKKKPNFLIVGAAKSGSTSLYQYLIQHPEVFMPSNKEPNFLVAQYQLQTSPKCPSYKVDQHRIIFNENDYFSLFDKANDKHKAIGEASVTYLYKPDYAIPEIKKHLGNPKIIIILRNPVKRALSQYSYICELGQESESLHIALKRENERISKNWSSNFSYIDQGRYFNQLKAYLNEFGEVKIFILEEFIQDPQFHMSELYKFLEIDDSFKNNFEEHFNSSGIPKSRLVHNLLTNKVYSKNIAKKLLSPFFSENKLRLYSRKVRALNHKGKIKFEIEDELKLYQVFKEEIDSIELLLNKDLNIWRKPYENRF